jgi:hypothetical protein
MLTKMGLNRAAARIALMPFFPASDVTARAVLIEELGSLCESDAHAEWLSLRLLQIFPKQWPGLSELRALYCKRFKPADGREVESAVFLDGFPTEDELGKLQIEGLPEPKVKALPPAASFLLEAGEPFTVDEELQALVKELAISTALPTPRQRRTIAEIEAELYKPNPPTPLSSERRAEIEAEIQAELNSRNPVKGA